MIELSQALEGERIRLIDIDGDRFEGKVTDYIYPEDNEPEGIASVVVRDKSSGRSIEFLEHNIKSIEVIS